MRIRHGIIQHLLQPAEHVARQHVFDMLGIGVHVIAGEMRLLHQE